MISARSLGVMAAIPLVFLMAFFIWPLAAMLSRSLEIPNFTLAHYQELLASGTYMRVGLRTLSISFVCALICGILGTPVSYFLAMEKGSFLAKVVISCIVSSFLMSSLVRAFSWMILLGASGPVVFLESYFGANADGLLGSPSAVVIGMVHFLLPIYILSVFSGVRSIDPLLIAAAESMGATRHFAIRTVWLPAASKSILRASMISFITAIGFFLMPALLGGPRQMMLASLISQRVDLFGDFESAAAAGFILLVFVAAVFVGFQLLIFVSRKMKFSDTRTPS